MNNLLWNKILRKVSLSALLVCVSAGALVLGGCGSKGTAIQVSIKDANETTILDTYAGETVSEMLEEAELTIGDQDKIEPALEDAVTEDGAEIDISRYASVNVIYDEGDPITVELYGSRVQDAIDESGVEVGKHDYIDKDVNSWLQDGEEIHITKRAKVTLVCDGKKTKIITAAKTVQEFLDEQGVELGKNDRLSPKKKTELTEGLKVVVKRVVIKKEKVKEVVAYTTETQSDSSMDSGTYKTKQAGVNGEKVIVYKVTYVDGKEESRKQISEKVTKEPVNEIIIKGTKVKKAARTVVSREKHDDCDGSGHGYMIITYSDGTTETVEY